MKCRLNLNAEEMRRWMAVSSLKQTVLEDGCAVEMNCTLSAASKYRSADGSCNNLVHPTWGKQATTFQRILPPAYGNGKTIHFNFIQNDLDDI
jgi:peroxidase